MGNYLFENNQVTVSGEITENFTFNHEVFGECFYITTLAINRTSDFVDYIPIIVSERLLDVKENWVGQFVKINGQFRSFNKHEEKKNRLVLTVFARDVEVLEVLYAENQIFLDGYVCKQPVYRKTPFGREITELLIAVNRAYGKSDYIPCVCWGRTARFASTFEVGTEVRLCGRIQSRPYSKKISDTETEERIAYEVSVSKIEL